MADLNYRTAGESHGPGVLAFLEGLPRGVEVDTDFIDGELRRRQGGYGRGGRQRIETDHAQYLGGVRLGRTTGAPVAMLVPNKDSRLDDLERTPPVERPRPGHADLAGSLKWLVPDCRETLERASARDVCWPAAGNDSSAWCPSPHRRPRRLRRRHGTGSRPVTETTQLEYSRDFHGWCLSR